MYVLQRYTTQSCYSAEHPIEIGLMEECLVKKFGSILTEETKNAEMF